MIPEKVASDYISERLWPTGLANENTTL